MPMSEDCQPGGCNEAEQESDGDAGKRDDVGQQVMLEIDREQHDQRAAEDEPRGEQRSGPVVPPGQREHRGRQRLDDRVSRRDRRAARTAAAAKERVADDRECSRTTKGRGRRWGTRKPATRSTRRAAGDGCRRSGSCRSGRRRGPRTTSANAPVIATASLDPEPLRFDGQREERRRLRQANAAVGASARRRVPLGSTGTPGNTRARTTVAQSPGGPPLSCAKASSFA